MRELTDSTTVAGLAGGHCTEAMAPYAAADAAQAYSTARADYVDGLQPGVRAVLPGYDSGVVAVLIVLFLIVAYNFKHYSSLLKRLRGELLSVRQRANVFNDDTSGRPGLMVSLVMVVCVSEAILLFSLVFDPAGVLGPFGLLCLLIGVTLGYYLLQLLAYSTVGWTFTGSGRAGQWLKGFNSSQVLLGICLVIPALVTLFYPESRWGMAWVAAAMYLVARGVFIIKGFKIFYTNLFSLVYFILYLCTLEIAPLLLLYRGVELIHYL